MQAFLGSGSSLPPWSTVGGEGGGKADEEADDQDEKKKDLSSRLMYEWHLSCPLFTVRRDIDLSFLGRLLSVC